MTQKPLMDQILLIIEAARLHSDTPHSSGRVISLTQDFYLTRHTVKRYTSMTPVRFKFAIRASERPQTHVLDSAATGIVHTMYLLGTHFLLS
jgi:hypothetical protein